MATKRLTPSVASNRTIKLYDAETGMLFRTVDVGGCIQSQPIVTESEMYVQVKSGNTSVIKYFSLPFCGLKRSVPV